MLFRSAAVEAIRTTGDTVMRINGHPERAAALTAGADALDGLAARFLAKASELEAAAPASGG